MSNKHNFDNHKTNIDIFSSSSDFGVLRAKKILEDDNVIVNIGHLWDRSIGCIRASPK